MVRFQRMKMRRLLSNLFYSAVLFTIATTIFVTIDAASGTPSTLVIKTDANGYLVTAVADQTSPITQGVFASRVLKTDASGNLLVTLGSFNPVITTLTTSNKSYLLYTGGTNPNTVYASSSIETNLTSSGGLGSSWSSAWLTYYKIAPTDTDISGLRVGSYQYLETGGAKNFTASLYGNFTKSLHLGTGTLSSFYGRRTDIFNGHAGAQLTTGGNMTNLYGNYVGLFGQSSNSTIGSMYGNYTLIENDYGSGVTNAYGDVIVFSGPVVPTTSVGSYIGTVIGSEKYSYYAADITAPSHFTGGIEIASTLISGTAPSSPIACTSPTIINSNGTATVEIDVGTTCAGISTISITLPTVAVEYNCTINNKTNPTTSNPSQTSWSSTGATFTNFSRTTGIATDWTDGDNVRITCIGG